MYINKPGSTDVRVEFDRTVITLNWGRRMITSIIMKGNLQEGAGERAYQLLAQKMEEFIKSVFGRDPGGQGEWAEASNALVKYIHLSNWFADLENNTIERIDSEDQIQKEVEERGQLRLNYNVRKEY
jgi:hypothetical protein